MRIPLLCWLVWCLGCLSLNAQYRVELQGGEGDQRVAYAGTRIRLQLSVLAASDEVHNACLFRLECSRPGLILESYTWSSPYENFSPSEDSIPSFLSLPHTLDAASLSGPGYPTDMVDFQLSNVTPGTSFFRSGKLVEVNFRLPEDFPLGPLVITPVVEGISRGFDIVSVDQIPPLTLDVQSQPPGFNTPPSITGLTDVEILEDQIWVGGSFLVDDDEQWPEDLLVTVHSADQTRIRDEDILVEGEGASRNIRMNPVPNASGDVMLTVSVSDGSATSQRSFLVHIVEVNDAPTILPIVDRQYLDPPSTIDIFFSVVDPDSPAESIEVYVESDDPLVVPYSGIQWSQVNDGYLLHLTPAQHVSGSSKITLIVSDRKLTTRSSFTVSIRRTNRPPELGALENVHMRVDEVRNVSIPLSDPDNVLTELQLHVESDNLTLFPFGSLKLELLPTPTIELRPAQGQLGHAIVTLVVNDGGNEIRSSFTVEVEAIHPPVIDGTFELLMDEDGELTHSFTVKDETRPAEELNVTVSSLNTELVLDAGLRLERREDGRFELFIQPLPNANGSGRLKITANNGQAVSEALIQLNVQAINDAPSISSVDNVSLFANQTVIVPVTLTDPDNDLNDLALTAVSSDQAMVSDFNLLIEGTGVQRHLRLVPNKDVTGEVRVTLSVSDTLGGQSFTTIVFDIRQDNNKPETWETWKQWVQLNPLPEGFDTPYQDADGDGILNWLEMVFVSDPLSSENNGWPRLTLDEQRPQSALPVLEYVIDKRLEEFVQITIRASGNLNSGSFLNLQTSSTDEGSGLKRVKFSVSPDQANGNAIFFIIETRMRGQN